MKFKAAILIECNKPLLIDEIELKNKLDTGQVLIKLNFSGICGKQVEEFEGKMGVDKFLPHLLGHEGFGEVVDKHSSVTKVKSGDKVVLHWMKGFGHNSATPVYFLNDTKINAGWITTFNEYAVISENRVTKVSNGFQGEIASLLGCAVTTGVGVVVNESNTRPYHTVAIVGCGGVGLHCINGARLLNVQLIDAYDIKDNFYATVSKYGATNYFNINQYQDQKYDKVFITATSREAIEFGYQLCAQNGDAYVIGVPGPNTLINLSALKIHRNSSLHGSSGGGIVPERDIPLYYELFSKGLINIKDSIAKIIKLDEINTSILEIKRGMVTGRHVISFNI